MMILLKKLQNLLILEFYMALSLENGEFEQEKVGFLAQQNP